MRPQLTALLLALACFKGVQESYADDDWPSLRGPTYDGTTSGRLEALEGAGFDLAWRRSLGPGYSSVAVAEGRAVTLFSDGKDDVAVAFDVAKGGELWRFPIAPTLRGMDGSFDGPIATPALSGGRVFGLGPRGHLFALTAKTGQPVWRVDLAEREGAVAPYYGFSASPVVASGVLVVAMGAKDGGAVGGFDPSTGARLWRVGDDTVNHQCPIVVTVGGRAVVVAVGDKKIFGIDPASGRLLFEHAHGGEDHPMAAGSMIPVPAGEGRLFIKHRQDSTTMLALRPGPEGRISVETLWTAPVLRSTYVVPVYHAGFLYGMSGRATLTCVDAASGEVRWRSREPGDGFPMIVGDDLVILTKEKTLHVGKASPEGWKERARLDLFGDLVWSPPGFASGAIFSRSLGEIARVDWKGGTERATVAEGNSGPTGPAVSRTASAGFRGFLAELESISEGARGAAVDRFLASLPPGPLVEWPDRVFFLYSGADKDVGIAGDMIGDRREDPMQRVPGTNLFWYETTLEPDARINYHFVRNFEERLPDPRNPWRVPAPPTGTLGVFPAEQSSLAMPAWRPPDHLAEARAERRGRLETHEVKSASRPGARVGLQVYVPAVYDRSDVRLPLALVLGGEAARDMGLLPRSLDNLIPSRVSPLLVAFVGKPDWGEKKPGDDEAGDALADLFARDVVGFLDERYRTDQRPERRAVIATGFDAWNGAYTGFRRSDVFGAVGLQSVLMLDSDEELLKKQVRTASETPLVVYLDWGRYDRRCTREAWDMRVTNARFSAFLRERGYRPAGGEAPEGSGWAGWRNRTDRLFEALFPALPRPTAKGSSAPP